MRDEGGEVSRERPRVHPLGAAATLLKMGNLPTARRLYDGILRDWDYGENRTRLGAAALLVLLQEYEMAFEMYEHVAVPDGTSLPALLALYGKGYVLSRLGRDAEAEYFWSTLVERVPNDYDGPVRGREILFSAYDDLVARAREIRLGGPFDESAETGPLTSAAHREKVEAYVAAGLAEGAVLRCGGARPDDPALADGFYYLPTVLDGCTSAMSVTQEESFGPVLTVETFADEDEAVRIANDSIYGLSAAIFTENLEWAMKFAREVQSGNLMINWGPQWRADLMPYGGLKDSGFGKEGPRYAVEEMSELKLVCFHLAG